MSQYDNNINKKELDSEQLRVKYETIIRNDSSNIEAVHYLAIWHLERQSFEQARKYFGHLATLCPSDSEVWICVTICSAMANELVEASTALKKAKGLLVCQEYDVRVRFCEALISEKNRSFTEALLSYSACLSHCNKTNTCVKINASPEEIALANGEATTKTKTFMRELKGELMLRMAVCKKEQGLLDICVQMCDNISVDPECLDAVKTNALCLKGLIHEMKFEFPTSEVVYRAVLSVSPNHSTALERLGRVYLRYRETIPAAVQYFFHCVEINPSNHCAWYLLGRCYMATAQYADAFEAYNRAINLNPNDPQTWCSLGVLYYSFGQYKESLGMFTRALKLEPTLSDAWYNIGALYDICEQPEDAQHAYLKAKINGLSEKFVASGVGINPIAMQSVHYLDNSGCYINNNNYNPDNHMNNLNNMNHINNNSYNSNNNNSNNKNNNSLNQHHQYRNSNNNNDNR